jgi:hypothetical protein
MLQASGQKVAEVHPPQDFPDNDNDVEDYRNGGSPDSHDDADFGFDQAAPQHPADGALDPLAAFIKELSGMTSPDISDIIDDCPIPQQQETESMTVNEAVQVSH